MPEIYFRAGAFDVRVLNGRLTVVRRDVGAVTLDFPIPPEPKLADAFKDALDAFFAAEKQDAPEIAPELEPEPEPPKRKTRRRKKDAPTEEPEEAVPERDEIAASGNDADDERAP